LIKLVINAKDFIAFLKKWVPNFKYFVEFKFYHNSESMAVRLTFKATTAVIITILN